ncbi:hypothetical protein EBR03_08840, partial [bacterium]|nr:hypothetical protein [bacterium]
MKKSLLSLGFVFLTLLAPFSFAEETSEIEKQLEEVGSIPDEEVLVVQRKFTRKEWRHEISPLNFGGIPFGTVRRTMTSGG